MNQENVNRNEAADRQRYSADAGFVNSIKRISWSSVFAGTLIALVVMIALSILGLGIGLGTIDAKTEENPVNGLGIGSGIWYVVTSLVSMYIGAWIAGRLARTPRLFDGLIHGLLTWSLVTLMTLYFFTSTIGSILGTAGRMVGTTLGVVGSAAGAGVSAAAPQIKEQIGDIDFGSLKQEAKTILRQTGKAELQPGALENGVDAATQDAKNAAGNAGANPQQTDGEIDGLIDQLFNRGKNVTGAVDKEAVINVIVARTGKTRAEASQIADNWTKTAEQAKVKWEQAKQDAEKKAREAADAAAKAGSTAAILIFVSLLLSAAIALFGAKRGTESKEDVNQLDHKIQAR